MISKSKTVYDLCSNPKIVKQFSTSSFITFLLIVLSWCTHQCSTQSGLWKWKAKTTLPLPTSKNSLPSPPEHNAFFPFCLTLV